MKLRVSGWLDEEEDGSVAIRVRVRFIAEGLLPTIVREIGLKVSQDGKSAELFSLNQWVSRSPSGSSNTFGSSILNGLPASKA